MTKEEKELINLNNRKKELEEIIARKQKSSVDTVLPNLKQLHSGWKLDEDRTDGDDVAWNLMLHVDSNEVPEIYQDVEVFVIFSLVYGSFSAGICDQDGEDITSKDDICSLTEVIDYLANLEIPYCVTTMIASSTYAIDEIDLSDYSVKLLSRNSVEKYFRIFNNSVVAI